MQYAELLVLLFAHRLALSTHFYKVSPPSDVTACLWCKQCLASNQKMFQIPHPCWPDPLSTPLLLTATLKHQKTSCEAKAGAATGFALGCHNTFRLNESDKTMRLQRSRLMIGTQQMLMVRWGAFPKWTGMSVWVTLTANILKRETFVRLKVKRTTDVHT